PPPPPPPRRPPPRPPPRRGLLENDILFERFFSRHEHDLTDADVGALSRLLDLSDNDLMDLLLARKEPEGDLDSPDVHRLLEMLRNV
ncbi:succinate dehydrogenase assembly factor 2, partial [Burkholderia vietnamiensis]